MRLVARITQTKLCQDFDRLPRGWGIAYRDLRTCNAIIARIPMNWFIGWGHYLYWNVWGRIKRGPRDRVLHSLTGPVYERAYQSGLEAGIRQSKAAFQALIEYQAREDNARQSRS